MFYNDDYRHRFENIVYQKYSGVECSNFEGILHSMMATAPLVKMLIAMVKMMIML